MAQPGNCVLKNPVVHVHFGSGIVHDINKLSLPNYNRVSSSCPYDGNYTFSSATPGCFQRDWFQLDEDHTPGDKNGNMMIVNAHPGGGVFLTTNIGGLRGGTTYEFASWVMNLCRLGICCSDLSPSINVSISSKSGKKIAGFLIGDLVQTNEPRWRRYRGFFTMPQNETEVVLTMQDNALGGCGNDFALDDITFRECVKQATVVQKKTKNPPPSIKNNVVAKKPVEKKTTTATKDPVPKIKPVTIEKERQNNAVTKSVTINKTLPAPLPYDLLSRENLLVKKIESKAGEIQIDLYDNGIVDGDSISVYHNNELLISKARLSQKPIRFTINIDPLNPHHELVMVANNLGSIPPNTSLMIVTTKEQRYQVFISSSEQKNAKVVFDIKQ